MITHHNRVYGESFIGEKFVSHIWDSGHFAKDALRAKDGRRIEILHQGQWNDDAGADFAVALRRDVLQDACTPKERRRRAQ